MALDNRLVVYNEQGEHVDYDILASDVKFLPDGKDLPTKLAELEDEIGQGGYAPPEGGIPKSDLAQDVQDSLDKADSALQDDDVAEVAKTGDYNDLENKPTIPDTSGLATKTELNAKQDKISAGNGIVIANDGKTVSVDAEVVQPATADGTFAVRIGNNTYTINLNHTHENMAKLIVCEESDLPSTLEEDTIYGVEEDGEISVLYVGGIPFYGGGGGVLPDEPMLRRPADGSTVDFGKGDSLTKVITIKGINLAHDLTLELSGSGYSFGTTQPTGVTRTDGTHMTITSVAANAGVDIVVDYAETGLYASGTLSIEGTADGIDAEVTLVANTDVVAYWDGGDAVQSGKWVDRVNQIPFVMGGTAEKITDGYHLNNLSSPRNAYMLTDSSKNTLLNTLIKKEFTCYVDFKLKFGTAGKYCATIDFGALGDSLSTLALACRIYQDGKILTTFKLNGEQTGFFVLEKNAQLDSALTLNSYVTFQLKIGARILANGKQELYSEIDGKKCYAVLNNPVNINFAGCSGGATSVSPAASLGFGYDTNAATDFPYGNYDIVCQKIKIYNTAR